MIKLISYTITAIQYKLGRLWYHLAIYPIGAFKWYLWRSKPSIKSREDTLQALVDGKKSICRFGDGEFNMALGRDIGFQKNSVRLTQRMNQVLHSTCPNILIGLPDIFGSLNAYSEFSRKWWREYQCRNIDELKFLVGNIPLAANSFITRFSSDYIVNSGNVLIPKFKQIWDGRDLYVVEGDKSRLGVGNDLFENTKSIKRIIVPAKGAFDIYDGLFGVCCKLIPKDCLVVIALGPTATILAYDLAVKGYQALDLGHIDIQYEYFLRGIHDKKAIPGKYVNEAGSEGQTVDDSIVDENYLQQIVYNFTTKTK